MSLLEVSSIFIMVVMLSPSYSGKNPGFNREWVHGVNANYSIPIVQTQPTEYRVMTGGTAILVCEIRNIGHLVRLWWNGTRVMSVGGIKVRRNERVVISEDQLTIKDVNVWDTGQYLCEAETDLDEPLSVKHFLQVTEPPKIAMTRFEDNLTALAASTISLKCEATGQPKPNITWRRTYDKMGTEELGEIISTTAELTLKGIERSDSGRYRCTADNGVGKPVHAYSQLNVLYMPEVRPVVSVIHGLPGNRIQLSCDVWSNPTASVTWSKLYKEEENYKFIKIQFDDFVRHTLEVYLQDKYYLGDYICTAQNSLGRSSATLHTRGNPEVPVITSDVLANKKESYTVHWKNQVDQEVTEYRLMYRKVPDGSIVYAWDVVECPAEAGNSCKIKAGVSQSQENSLSEESANRMIGRPKTENLFYNITNLQPDSSYVLTIQSRNRYGWSDQSKDFTFYTRGKESLPKESQIRETDPVQVLLASSASKLSASMWTAPNLTRITLIIFLQTILFRFHALL